MSQFNHANSATRIRHILLKSALFGWEPRFNAQLIDLLVWLQENDSQRAPEIAARAKLLTYILEDLPKDAKAKSRFAEISQHLAGLVRLIDHCFETPNLQAQARAVNAVRHKRTWRRIAANRVSSPVDQAGFPAVLSAIAQMLQDPHLAGQTREALQALMQADSLSVRAPSEEAKSLTKHSTAENQNPRPRILVAEDDLGCQSVVKLQLTTLGYDSAFAANGTAAFGLWLQGDFSAVFADLNMPGADGLTLTRAIRATESVRGGSIPIIAITAAKESKQLVACLEAGMNDVLPKPIELERMRELLARYLSASLPAAVVEAATEPRHESFGLDMNYLVRVIGSENLDHVPELMELFISSTRLDLEFCRELLANPDGKYIAKSMHKLKSSARMIGALPFAEMAEGLEAAIQAGRMAEAAVRIEEMSTALTQLKNACQGGIAVDWQPASQFRNQLAADLLIPEPVLIVDDDALARRQLRLMLNTVGISQVVTSSSAAAALIELRQAQPRIELVISDLSMPAMPGLTFLSHIADLGYGGYLLLISGAGKQFLDSAVEFARTRDMRLLGALSKPVTLENLTDCFKISDFAHSNAGETDPAEIGMFDMSQAIRNDEFEIFFRPKLATANLKPAGIVAQLSWQCRDRPVAAQSVLALAERYGLGEELFKLLFTKSLIGGSRIAEAGFASSLTVNLPAHCLRNSTLPAFILASLNAVGFNPESLMLEISQAGLLAEMPMAWESLARLCLQGIRLSLGDLSADSLSIESACRIPFTELSLDIGFAREAAELQRPEFVTRIVDTAKACNLRVLADHVHTQDDLTIARDFGCEYFRGNLFGQAMPQTTIIEWLGANR